MHNGEDLTEALLDEAEALIGYRFADRALLIEALTHKSWSNLSGGANNERLEFLGDAVLELVVSEWLYAAHPSAEEGELTALRQQYVSKTALGRLCRREGLMRFLRFSGGEQNLGKKTVESLPEALLGAIYLDGGLKAARKFVAQSLTPAQVVNYKSLLQEFVQKRTKVTPEYSSREQGGVHRCTVRAMGEEAQGEGENRPEAEYAAAEKLYRKLTENT